jgi:putative acetyltransferase
MSERPLDSTNIIIRPETSTDHQAVAAINTLAFGGPNEAHLVAMLRDLPGTISLVAEISGEPVGHICFSLVEIIGEQQVVPATALAPMAVLPEHQRQGIGSRLISAGLAACRQAGHRLVIVLGHPWYYPRFGFVPAAPLGIKYPHPVPEEVFMVYELVPGAAAGISGTARYPAAFSAVE